MKILSTILLLSFTTLAFGQITITKNDVPMLGDQLGFAIDTLPVGFSPTPPGPDQTWDFSTLGSNFTYTEELIDIAGTPGEADFPTATGAIIQGGFYAYIENRDDGVYLIGLYGDFGAGTPISLFLSLPLDPPNRQFALPSTYQTSYINNYVGFQTIESPVPGTDSLRITNDAVAESEIDAFGVVETPFGFYNALRQKVTTTTELIIEAQVFGLWFEQSRNTTVEVAYHFYNKEVKGRLLEYTIDSIGNAGQITYSTIPGAQGIPPIASFDIMDQGGNTFLFTDNSYDNITSREWDFGDGTMMSTTGTSISHTYTNGGTYEVCLTVENSFGSDQLCQPLTVLSPPVADFTFADAFEGVVNFQDASDGNPTAWSWDFGNGSSSTMENPSHTFASPGSYNVCLTVTNSLGDNMVCKTVSPIFKPVADFSYVNPVGTASVSFSDESANGPSSWFWDFGDGATSPQQNPSHDFPSDDYNVCLTASNAAGSNQLCKDITVIIASLADLENQIALQVYPNPVSDLLQIHLEELPEAGSQLMITNRLGQSMYVETLEQRQVIALGQWVAGTYSWNILSKKGALLARGAFVVAH